MALSCQSWSTSSWCVSAWELNWSHVDRRVRGKKITLLKLGYQLPKRDFHHEIYLVSFYLLIYSWRLLWSGTLTCHKWCNSSQTLQDNMNYMEDNLNCLRLFDCCYPISGESIPVRRNLQLNRLFR